MGRGVVVLEERFDRFVLFAAGCQLQPPIILREI